MYKLYNLIYINKNIFICTIHGENIMHIVIIGAGATGLTLASNLRDKNNETEITVFTRNEEIAYSPCAIPLALGGSVDSFDDIVMHDAD